MIRFGPKSETKDAKPAKGKAETAVKEPAPEVKKPAAKAAPKGKKAKKATDGTLL